MKRILLLIIILLLCVTVGKSEADYGGMGMGLGYEDMEAMMNSMEKKPKTDQEAAERVQAQMIEMLFLAPIFKNNDMLKANEDEEDEDSMFSSSEDNKFYNVIMTRELAKTLAKRDMLKMNSQLMKMNQK